MTAKDDPETLRALLKGKLNARGDSLEAQLAQARRKLPRKLAQRADELAAAERRRRYRPDLPPIGEADLKRARGQIARHLEGVGTSRDDRAARQKARRRWASGLTLNLLLAMGAIGAFAWVGSQL